MLKWSVCIFCSALVVILPLTAAVCNGFIKKSVVFSVSDINVSKIAEKKCSSSRCYVFSDQQKKAVASFFDKNGDAALLVQLKSPKKITPEMASARYGELSFGLLTDDDIPLSKSFAESLPSHPVVKDSFSSYDRAPFALAICFDKDKPLPAGFFVSTRAKCVIESVQVIRGCIGHNFSGDVPVYAFGPNGGVNDKRQDDFSGASMVFSSVNSNNGLMPVFQLKFSGEEASEDSDTAEVKKIAFGGEVISIRDDSSMIEIPSAALKNPFSVLTSLNQQSALQTVMLVSSDPSLLKFSSESKNVLSPIKCDPGLIIGWSRNNWRGNDYELFEWDRFPGVLIFDFSTYAVQDDFLKRMAFFVEKKGYKGTLWSDEDLAEIHAYNAHDYRAESLAEFFDRAEKENFPLNSRERLLKRILAENGIIVVNQDGSVVAGRGAIISISQESPVYLRSTFIAHEGWHGIFFSDDDFRNAVSSIYYTMDQKSLAYLRKYFQVTPSLNYDVDDDYLMKNEFMAYMLQRPLRSICKYYVDAALRNYSQIYAKNEADYIIQTNAQGFESAAILLDQYVYDRWKLNAGRVWMLSR